MDLEMMFPSVAAKDIHPALANVTKPNQPRQYALRTSGKIKDNIFATGLKLGQFLSILL